MNLIPHSNGLHSVNMRRQWRFKDIMKILSLTIGVLLLLGFIYQKTSDFIADEKLKQKVDYTRVNNMRLDYLYEGKGDCTVIFDGNTGANFNQWSSISKKLYSEYGDVRTFTYNRRGYGFSDGGETRTPQEQAEDLEILLRKASASPPYILVGEEYGSLVLTNFAKIYPETVAGVVLIDPIMESEMGSKEIIKANRFVKFRRKIEEIGSHFGLTSLMQKLGLNINLTGFEDKLDNEALEEFTVHRTKVPYTKAVNNELNNIMYGSSKSQTKGLLEGKPYCLIAKEGQESLKDLGSPKLTKIYPLSNDSKILSMENENTIIDAIRYVVKHSKNSEVKKQ